MYKKYWYNQLNSVFFICITLLLKNLTVYTTSQHTHLHTLTHSHTHTRKALTQEFQFDVFMHYVIIYIYNTSNLTYMLKNNPYADMNTWNTRKLTYIHFYIAKLLITTEDMTQT